MNRDRTYRVRLTGAQIEALTACAMYIDAGEWPEDGFPSRDLVMRAVEALIRDNPKVRDR
jgi:hypothetical protein